MLHVRIHAPQKSEDTYAIPVTVIPEPGAVPQQKMIGFRARNFTIPHSELWDSFLPLMWLSRNGGPIFGKDGAWARVRADYPLNAAVVDFFEQRAREFGIGIEVVSKTVAASYDLPTNGTSVLFGGGKDSRLLLGTLRELGETPSVVSAKGAHYATDIEGALIFDTFDFAMPNRIVPAMMLGAKHIYHGSGLGEVHISKPWWQQYYDISAVAPVGETNALLKRLGADITVHVPQCILPYNIVQLILARRYPGIFAGQISVEPGERSEKNLHITLLKRYHGIAHQRHCPDALLLQMAQRFIVNSARGGFGYRGNREVINREMRAILYRLHQRGDLDLSGDPPPDAWDAPWIDFIHSYANPDVDHRLMGIYGEYAKEWSGDRDRLPVSLQRYFTAS